MKSDHLKVGFQSVDRETICRSCPTAARFIVDDCHRKSTHDPFIDIHWNVLLAQLSHWPSRFTEFWWIWWIFWRLQEPETRAKKRTPRKRIEGREREREKEGKSATKGDEKEKEREQKKRMREMDVMKDLKVETTPPCLDIRPDGRRERKPRSFTSTSPPPATISRFVWFDFFSSFFFFSALTGCRPGFRGLYRVGRASDVGSSFRPDDGASYRELLFDVVSFQFLPSLR